MGMKKWSSISNTKEFKVLGWDFADVHGALKEEQSRCQCQWRTGAGVAETHQSASAPAPHRVVKPLGDGSDALS